MLGVTLWLLAFLGSNIKSLGILDLDVVRVLLKKKKKTLSAR